MVGGGILVVIVGVDEWLDFYRGGIIAEVGEL